MADGSVESIQDVRVGDEIANAQPDRSGEEHHKVTAVHVTDTDRDYTTLVIKSGKSAGSITGTSRHIFYDLTNHAWTPAGGLAVGDKLQTPTGDTAVVTAIRNFTRVERTYSLTVDGLHTYYVVAGDTPVLVHNASFNRCDLIAAANNLPKDYPERTAGILDVGTEQMPFISGGGEKDTYGQGTHVEDKVASFLSANPSIKEAVLYLDNAGGPCRGCINRLPDQLPANVDLWIIGPDGQVMGPPEDPTGPWKRTAP